LLSRIGDSPYHPPEGLIGDGVMKGLRLLVSFVVGLAAAIGVVLGIANSGLADVDGVAGGLYSSLVIYPAGVLVFAFVFWIIYTAMDPGSEQ
jgi:hypothetical protein